MSTALGLVRYVEYFEFRTYHGGTCSTRILHLVPSNAVLTGPRLQLRRAAEREDFEAHLTEAALGPVQQVVRQCSTQRPHSATATAFYKLAGHCEKPLMPDSLIAAQGGRKRAPCMDEGTTLL